MINAPVATNRVPNAVLLLIAFGSLIAALIAAMLNAEIRTAIVGTLPLLGRYALLLMLPPLLAWGAFRAAGSRVSASSLLLLGLSAAFAMYAGLAQAAAVALLLAASVVCGRLLTRAVQDPSAGLLVSATLGGLGLIVGVLGWLLPLHIHSSAASLVVLALLVFAGREQLRASLQVMGAQW